MEKKKSVVTSSAFQGVNGDYRVSSLVDGFIEYAQYELNFSPNTLVKYRDSLKWFVRDVGDKDVRALNVQDFVTLKKKMMQRGARENRIGNIIFAVRSFLNYCREFLELETIDPKKIKPPRKIKREVIYLKKDEIERFIGTIKTHTMTGLRFRTLVEVLLGTGMRIGEALSLNRDSIDWENKQAKIIGKGNKERMVYFTDRSLKWIEKLMESRSDAHEAIFITKGEPRRLSTGDIWRFFGRHRVLAGIKKPITPHILRHTVATNLIFNGCPIIHVKEILGHEKLDTTCQYYLGVDKEKAKAAHIKYLEL